MNKLSNPINWIRRGKWIKRLDNGGIVILGILLLGSTVLWMFSMDEAFLSRFRKSLYYSFQFITLGKDVDGVNDPCLRHALYVLQFAIPLFASGTFVSQLFRNRLVPFLKRVEVNALTNHHVIIGYGAFGQALAKKLVDKKRVDKKNVVAIDLLDPFGLDDTNPIVLCHDALHTDIGKIANLQHAECLYLLLPEERDNQSILKNILASNSLKEDLRIFVRTASGDMQRLCVDWVGLKGIHSQEFDIRALNPFDIVARGIVNTYAPDVYAPTDRVGPVAQTIMVVGTSEAAKALLVRFARIGVFSPKGKLHVVWAGDGVEDAFRQLKAVYPALGADFSSVNDWGGGDKTSREYFESVLPPIKLTLLNIPAAEAIRKQSIAVMDNTRWPSVIYVCHDSDIRNLVEARDLQAALCMDKEVIRTTGKGQQQRLILAVQGKADLGIAEDADLPALQNLPYRIKEISIDFMFAKTVAEDRADEIAKGYFDVYAESHKVEDKDWNHLKLFEKESNRDLADHLAMKARYAGIGAEKVTASVFYGNATLSNDECKLMEEARAELIAMEQRRYRAFMFMNGFIHGSHPVEYDNSQKSWGKKLDQYLRVNDTLLQENLPEDEQKKDDDIVDYSLQVLRLKNLAAPR
ncbi:MAG: hypothetical protein FDX21_00905 [Chlorobium sp.]|nr:MAG: hypothetical protein FDX21_00905 [Chlorobium sp.]